VSRLSHQQHKASLKYNAASYHVGFEDLTVAQQKMQVIWDVMQFCWAGGFERMTQSVHAEREIVLEDKGTTILQTIMDHSPNDTMPHTIRLTSVSHWQMNTMTVSSIVEIF
jgi:hypothetical protein